MDELIAELAHLLNYRNQIPDEGFAELINDILAPLPASAGNVVRIRSILPSTA